MVSLQRIQVLLMLLCLLVLEKVEFSPQIFYSCAMLSGEVFHCLRMAMRNLVHLSSTLPLLFFKLAAQRMPLLSNSIQFGSQHFTAVG